ncbi:MAG: hypothetical protein WA323_23930, partial [Candidatus Nitrosopolaris sp.]
LKPSLAQNKHRIHHPLPKSFYRSPVGQTLEYLADNNTNLPLIISSVQFIVNMKCFLLGFQ